VRDERAYATVVACFAAGLYLALLVAAFGLISLATNTEVIADPSVGTLVGPVMAGAAVVMLLVFLISLGRRVPAERQRISPGVAFGVAVACYFVFVAAGGVAGAAGDPSQPFRYFLFAFAQLGSVYSIVTGILAFVVTLLYQLVLVGRFRQRGRPRWPWERDEDE
jgi:predicted RND superfamily exporter protein